MEDDLAYKHFGLYGLRIFQANEFFQDELAISFYFQAEAIKKTYSITDRDSIYSAGVFEEFEEFEGSEDSTCVVCGDDCPSLQHNEIDFLIHEDCRGSLKEQVEGFVEESPVDIVSQLI